MSSWWGKITGAFVGGYFGGPIGAIIGGVVGHGLDVAFRAEPQATEGRVSYECSHCHGRLIVEHFGPHTCPHCGEVSHTVACTFCKTPIIAPGQGMFRCPHCSNTIHVGAKTVRGTVSDDSMLILATVMLAGKLAKIDGRITPSEINVVSAFLDSLKLNADDRSMLQDVFRHSKESPHQFAEIAQQMAGFIGGNKAMVRQMMYLLMQIALADGVLHPKERKFMAEVARILGLSKEDYWRMLDEMTSQRPISPHMSLKGYYDVLGVSSDISDELLKRRYRELVAQYHPDVVARKGDDEHFQQMAHEKMSAITEAYDKISKYRESLH